jgi:hypothetical protein
MAKRKVVCPECGHKFDTFYHGIQSQTAGVRFIRTTENQFQTTINMPGEIVECKRFYTAGDQLLGALVVGVGVGTLTGYFVSIPWHVSEPGIAAEIIVGSALTGWAICSVALVRMQVWEKCKKWPFVIGQYLALAKGKIDSIELIVDHRYRDGHTEIGRTVKRFGPLPVDEERFNEWVKGALVGKSLGISHWTPKAKMFTKPEYLALLEKMTAGGIVVNLGSSKGNTLTGGGQRALRRHLADCGIEPPSPASEDFLGERLAQAKQANGISPLPRSGVRA